jgi:curli production assembly/transport component CsgF
MCCAFRSLIIGVGIACVATTALAGSLVYTPTNPTFGGNPLNGTFLLSTAQAQGEGTKAGQNSPNLSGLNSALSGLSAGTSVGAPVVVIGGSTIPSTP